MVVYSTHPFSSSLINTYHNLKMSARTASNALRSSAKQLARPAARQQRNYIAAALQAGKTNAIRQSPKVAVSSQQTRGVKTVDFAGVKEQVFGEYNNVEWWRTNADSIYRAL